MLGGELYFTGMFRTQLLRLKSFYVFVYKANEKEDDNFCRIHEIDPGIKILQSAEKFDRFSRQVLYYKVLFTTAFLLLILLTVPCLTCEYVLPLCSFTHMKASNSWWHHHKILVLNSTQCKRFVHLSGPFLFDYLLIRFNSSFWLLVTVSHHHVLLLLGYRRFTSSKFSIPAASLWRTSWIHCRFNYNTFWCGENQITDTGHWLAMAFIS